MSKNKKMLLRVFGGTVILFIYLMGVLRYSYHFLPHTSINGTQVGGQTLEQAEPLLLGEKTGELIFLGRNGEREAISLEEIDYKPLISMAAVSELKEKQNYYAWPFLLLNKKEHDLKGEGTYHKENLKREINALELVSGSRVIAPVDAAIVPLKDGYVIKPEEQGNKLDEEKLTALAEDHLSKGSFELDLEQEGAYLSPQFIQESGILVEGLEKLNRLTHVEIKYIIGDQQAVVDYSTFGDWLHIDQQGGIETDRGKVRGHIAQLGQKYDTVGKERRFETSKGAEITISGGIFGWKIDVDSTTNQLIELLAQGISQELEPLYLQKGKKRKGNEIGNSYVEIDLTSQHLWQYIDGELVLETPIVSGLPTPERETPTGVFYIWSMERKRYLEGDDYKLWVEYWLPINFSGIGIHDSTWQPAYGPDQLWVTGSHGCINTPPDLLPEIYSQVEVGTPVIVYK